MQSGKKITPAIAYEKFGCLRLSERIRELEYGFTYYVNRGWKQVNKHTRVRVYYL